MTEYNVTASTPVLVAIDISKGRHEVLIEVPDKKRHLRVSVLNTLDEFERLINLLRSFQRPVRVAFEATENYHRGLAFQLGAAVFDIKLISSIALRGPERRCIIPGIKMIRRMLRLSAYDEHWCGAILSRSVVARHE